MNNWIAELEFKDRPKNNDEILKNILSFINGEITPEQLNKNLTAYKINKYQLQNIWKQAKQKVEATHAN